MTKPLPPLSATQMPPQDWIRILSAYREPNEIRSMFELGVSVIPFVGLWVLALWTLSISGWIAVAIAALNAGFLLRIFIIQHDCGHGSYFRNRHVADWTGRVLGVLTLTPYDVWRKTHAIHHGASGNLDKRGIGDVHTLTVTEFRAMSAWGRFWYRVYRNPVVMFGLGPCYLFLVQNRYPFSVTHMGAKYWVSAMGTNLAIVVALGLLWYFGGLMALLLVFFPTLLVAASVGVWLFYVQHQFEDTQWDRDESWQVHDAALQGSSNYDLPLVLRWFTGNIGIHHVHHLYARIPFYRLPQVLRDHPALAEAQKLTLRDSWASARFHLWDEKSRRLMSFSEARRSVPMV